MTLCDDCLQGNIGLYMRGLLCCLARSIADTPGRTGRTTHSRPVSRKAAQWARLQSAKADMSADEWDALFARFKKLVGAE
jgi:hypothetical protein